MVVVRTSGALDGDGSGLDAQLDCRSALVKCSHSN